VIGALLLAAVLAAGAAGPDSTAASRSPEPAARWFRMIATAGPTLVRHDGEREPAVLGLGTGFQMGSTPWMRFTGRWEVHASRKGAVSTHTTVMLFGFKLQYQRAGWPAWPYAFVGTGYGTAPDYSDFALPAAAEAGLGLQFALPGGQEIFLETAALGAGESTITPVRLGVLLP
jgi:hypothetical protein